MIHYFSVMNRVESLLSSNSIVKNLLVDRSHCQLLIESTLFSMVTAGTLNSWDRSSQDSIPLWSCIWCGTLCIYKKSEKAVYEYIIHIQYSIYCVQDKKSCKVKKKMQ